MQDNPFWQYSVAIYQRESVEQLLLELQNEWHADVNLLLCCCWLGSRGETISASQFAALVAATTQWREECIIPLRSVRCFLKGRLGSEGLRDAVKALELEAENHQQHRIYQALMSAEDGDAEPSVKPAISESAIALNFRAYCNTLDGVGWCDIADQITALIEAVEA